METVNIEYRIKLSEERTEQFNFELHFPGEVSVGTAVSRIGNTSYTLAQGLFQEDRCIANSEVITVYMGKETGRPTPLTEELRAALQEVALIGA